MKVAELVAQLQDMPQDAEVYFAAFEHFLNESLGRAPNQITEREAAEVYNIVCEHKTVYQWATRKQEYVPYTGAIFEID